MLKILQNEKMGNGLMVLGFGLLAVGIAMNFQAKKTDKTEIKIESRPSYAPQELRMGEIKGISSVPTNQQEKPVVKIKEEVIDKNKVNLNTANLAQLDTLKGIGPAIGQRIIDYRKEKGGFMNVEEIKLVKGIGDKMYEKIKDQIEI